MLLRPESKAAVTAAFRDNSKRVLLSEAGRKEAAQFYEQIATMTTGSRAELATLYNRERARFLRGEIESIERTAQEFANRIVYGDDGEE